MVMQLEPLALADFERTYTLAEFLTTEFPGDENNDDTTHYL